MDAENREKFLQSFIEEYARIYLIDLDRDRIEKIAEAAGQLPPEKIKEECYSEFNHRYCAEKMDPDYASWGETICSIDHLRSVLSGRHSFAISYLKKDGSRRTAELRLFEKCADVPTRVLLCVPDRKADGENSSDMSRMESGPFVPEETALGHRPQEFRVLLAEDNALNREIARELLEDLGMQVDLAENGEIAVNKVARSDGAYYDLVLMDLQMPVMDGYEAARCIRRLYDPEHANVPIIAMTADAFDENAQKAGEAGMNACITKPVEPETLQYTLEKVLYGER